MELENSSYILNLIEERALNKFDTNVIIGGERGIGKSSTALRFGELWKHSPIFRTDPVQAVEKQVHFTAVAFLKARTTLRFKEINIYDEPAQTWHHREYMSDANIILSKITIGDRYRMYFSPLCVPTIDMIDKDARKICKYYIYIEKRGNAQVFQIMPQKFGGEPWYNVVVDELEIVHPSEKLWKAYEEKKQREEVKLASKWVNELEFKDQVKLSNSEIIHAVLKDPNSYKRRNADGSFKPIFNVERLMDTYGVGIARARVIKSNLENRA